MDARLTLCIVVGCSTSDAEQPRSTSAPAIDAPVVQPQSKPAPRPKLTIERLMQATEMKPGVSDWDVNYEAFSNWLGPVTRVVDLKYFWAIIEGERCGIVYIAKRRKQDTRSIYVAPYVSKRGGIMNHWCVAIATGGPLPPMQKTPSTGYDAPGPD